MKPAARYFFALYCLGFAMPCLFSPGSCLAQQMRFGVGTLPNSASFISPPRRLRQRLTDAELAIKEGQLSEGVVALGDVLEQDTSSDGGPLSVQDFFLDGNDDESMNRVSKSFLRHCRSLIGALPSAGREIYELRYGASALQLLQTATASRDWNLLCQVRRKYFHTQAGYHASVLLAQRELHRGHPLAASMLLDEVVETPAAIEFLGSEVELLHAVACRLSGRSLPKLTDLSSVKVAVGTGDDGQPNKAEPVGNLRKWIDARYTFRSADAISHSNDYLQMGGNAARNDTSQGQLPLSTPRWMLPTTGAPLEHKKLKDRANDLAASGRLTPPTWSPIRVGNQLLMRTTERLQGVDYRTGKRVWQYPFYPPDEVEEESDGGQGSIDPADRLARLVWRDLPYGQLSSDGQRVYLLDDLAPLERLQFSPLMGMRGQRSADSGKNTLVALELKTEGKILWRVGQNPTIESELNDAFFLGPPLAVEGFLYAMVEISGDIVLVCLDPTTGHTQWQQQLVSVEGFVIQADESRRIAGAMPSYHEGVLLCPTGAGATVALNLADRTLRWGNPYPRSSQQRIASQFQPRQTISTTQSQSQWQHSLAMASGNTVLVTPAGTELVLCFDLVDGKKRFSKPRQNAFYVAGIREDQFLLIGARDVMSYDLESGRLRWRSVPGSVTAGQQIVGRGVFGDGNYLVPTSGNELLQFSLEDGSVSQRRTTRYPLGNLIAIDGEIISQSPTTVAVAFGAKTLGPRVDRMLQENPKDMEALIQKAQLLTQQGKRTEALAVLQIARELDPDSDDVAELSIASMLGVLRESESPPKGLEEELERLIETPEQRLEFLALRLQSSLRSGNVAKATSELLSFSALIGRLAPGENRNDSILRDPTRTCQLGNWSAARAVELLRLAAENEQSDVVNELVTEFVDKRLLMATPELEKLYEQLWPLQIDAYSKLLADRKLTEGDLLTAERLLMGIYRPAALLTEEESLLTPNATVDLAKIYEAGGFNKESELLGGSTVPQETSIDSSKAQTMDANSGVTLNWETGGTGTSSRFAPKTSLPIIESGQTFQGWKVVNISGTVLLQNALGESRNLPLDGIASRNSIERKATISGGLMLLESRGNITAVDLFSVLKEPSVDPIRWSKDFGTDGTSGTIRRIRTTDFGDTRFFYPTNSRAADVMSEFRIGPVLGDRVIILQAGDLLAVRTTDRERLWRNSDAPPFGHIVADQGRVAVVSHETNLLSQVVHFDALDGRKLDQAEWTHGNLWASSGKHVLAYQRNQDGSSATVRLVDPFSEQVVLETQALIKQPIRVDVGKGLGRIIQDRFMVLFDTTGNLVVWDLTLGKELCRHQSDPMPELQSLHAMWVNGQILVLPANEIVRMKQSDLVTHDGAVHRSVHRVLSVSTETGELNWERQFDQPWGISIDQPFDSPVVALTRSQAIFSSTRPTARQLDVQLIRLSDGETIHEELKHSIPSKATGLATRVVVFPEESQIRVSVDTETLIYTFGEQAALDDQTEIP